MYEMAAYRPAFKAFVRFFTLLYFFYCGLEDILVSHDLKDTRNVVHFFYEANTVFPLSSYWTESVFL